MSSYTYDTHAFSVDADITGRWSPYTVFARMQDLADLHARQLRLSRFDLVTKGVVWVIARAKMQINRYPNIYERLRCKTFYGAPTRVGFHRYFAFFTDEGELLGKASALWLLADAETHKFVSPFSIGMEFPDQQDDNDLMMETNKIIFNESQPLTTTVRTPVYSDYDINMHVNNARYVQWVCDLFPVERMQSNMLSCLELNYVAEVKLGESVKLELADHGSHFEVRGRDQATGQVKFIASGSFTATR